MACVGARFKPRKCGVDPALLLTVAYCSLSSISHGASPVPLLSIVIFLKCVSTEIPTPVRFVLSARYNTSSDLLMDKALLCWESPRQVPSCGL